MIQGVPPRRAASVQSIKLGPSSPSRRHPLDPDVVVKLTAQQDQYLRLLDLLDEYPAGSAGSKAPRHENATNLRWLISPQAPVAGAPPHRHHLHSRQPWPRFADGGQQNSQFLELGGPCPARDPRGYLRGAPQSDIGRRPRGARAAQPASLGYKSSLAVSIRYPMDFMVTFCPAPTEDVQDAPVSSGQYMPDTIDAGARAAGNVPVDLSFDANGCTMALALRQAAGAASTQVN